ncbi:MAG: penicillin-binding protein 2 [Gammaproteobacteria bacterium RIFCSPHIGHO2_12_FULL_37_14]|nr:MAG: penicillin-binding protein 2 [Gammaproteobacteria bacterium RIFCSPHIGHO2_12_FULL_37_14]
MQRLTTIKNPHQEIQLITNRVIIALVVIICSILLLVARLAYLQIYKHDLYTTLSTKNWLDLVPVEPTRGLIYDRNNVLLVENIPVFSLDIIPIQATNLSKTFSELSKIIALNENDINQFNKQLKQHRRFDEIPLKLRLTEDEVNRFAENQHRFPGVAIKARLIRHYPYGKSFSHVIGYMGRINAQELEEIDSINYSANHYIGKLGIEKYYEDDLHGKVGYQQVENDANGKTVRILKEIKSTPGKNISLTLDIGLQLAAEKALDGRRGAVVAIQPATGQVLAMVSQPGYDPNQFVLGINQNDYQLLQQSPDRPLYNRALRGLYPLASTIKPYLALAGLDAGMIQPNDTIYDPGWFELRNHTHRFHDWVRYGHGKVDLNKAIVSSCDIYFYNLANKMGIHRMDAILTQFGFGSLTGIDIEEEISGVVASPEWKRRVKGASWYDGDTINSSIGQGYMRTTPLQLALATSILANRGHHFIPYLLLGEQIPGKALMPQPPMQLNVITLQDNHWHTVITAMQNVVNSPRGTAYRYGHKHHYTIAAKTGTAQIIGRRGNRDEIDKQDDLQEKLRDHHLFIAFAPVDKPTIALAVITENSNTAIEAARDILDYYFGSAE